MEWDGRPYWMRECFETAAEHKDRLERLDKEQNAPDWHKKSIREKLAELNDKFYPSF